MTTYVYEMLNIIYFASVLIHVKILSMNYLCKVCGEPAFSEHNYNYFQELSCEDCLQWVEDVMEYTKLKILTACGSYEVFRLLAQVDSGRPELFD